MKKLLLIIAILGFILIGCENSVDSQLEKIDQTEANNNEYESNKIMMLLGSGDFNNDSYNGMEGKPEIIDGYLTIENGKQNAHYNLILTLTKTGENPADIKIEEVLSIDIKNQSVRLTEDEIDTINEVGTYSIYETQEINKYMGIRGTVIDVESNEIVLQDDYNDEINFIINDKIKYKDEIEKGDEVEIYYDFTRSTIMIHPSQYDAIAVVKIEENVNVVLNEFDDNLLNTDGTLQINLDNKSEYANKYLLVKYDVTTKDIPPQTTPLEVVIIE